MTPPNRDLDTKARLLEAGIEVFADRGFADASIRQICSRAGANPAAVNYHFGDKQSFYAEVLATCHLTAVNRRSMPRLKDQPDDPAAMLRRWIRWFLEMLLVEDGTGHLGRLMAHEMVDPTPALDELVRRSLLPMKGALSEMITALLGDQASPEDTHLSLASVLGQCLFYKHSQPVLQSLARVDANGAAALSSPDIDRLATHIADFSLAALARESTQL